MRNFLRLALASAVLLTGCKTELVDCAEEPTDPGCVESCRTDPTQSFCDPMDMGPGDMPMTDMGPCGRDCGDQVCNTGTGECVDCLTEAECSDPTPFCGADNTCVGCTGDADCTDPANGKCSTETNACVPCDDSVQCTEDGAGVCDGGACVECTIEMEESSCGEFSCNPTTNECTTNRRGQTNRCGSCVADSECTADHKCVALDYMDAPRGGYCLLELPDTSICPPGYQSTIDSESLSGQPTATYCGIDTDNTTCEARLAIGESCSSMSCVEGGRCETITGVGQVCTISCSTTTNCPSDPYDSCGSGFCGS